LEPGALASVVDVVNSEIQRLDRLVTDFLAFARPKRLERRPSDANELVRGVITLVEPEARTVGVNVVERLDPSAGIAELEPERVRQALLNLTRNALEAMSDGGTLTLTTQSASNGDELVFGVHDTGPGFADEEPVFDAFYTTKEQGTGLGLAIVHRIVSEHGGSVSVESQPGSTRFSMVLPRN
jgi:signal transduction histidine kinase